VRYSYTLLTADTSHTTSSAQKGCTGLFRLSHITMLALEVAGKRGGDRKTREQLTENKCMPCPFARHRCFSPEPQCPLGVERTTAVLYGSLTPQSIGLVIKVVIICRVSIACCLLNSFSRSEEKRDTGIFFAIYLRILRQFPNKS